MSSRPDLIGEMRLRLPLPIVIPLVAVVAIAAIAFGFSRVLLTIPHEAATVVAIVTSANILIACAFIALRPRLHRVGLLEVVLIALYPIVIAVVIANTGIGTETAADAAEEASGAQAETGATPGGGSTLTAEGLAFDTEEVTLSAGKEATVTLDNQDTAPHNFAIYASEEDGASQSDPLFQGKNVDGGSSVDYRFDSPKPGDYYFQCDLHPTMNGTVTAE